MGNKREAFKPDTVYHIYNHGNAEDLIFQEDKNYDFFLKKYQQYVSNIVETYAYCLMPNHFHFLIGIKGEEELLEFYGKNPQGFRDPEGLKGINISNFVAHKFGTFLNSYTKSYNKYYNRRGSLFLNTTKRKSITSGIYFLQLIRYVHLNPVKHGFVNEVTHWIHSSYPVLLSEADTFLKREPVLNRFGGREEFIQAHNKDSL
jgi:REP element-mobilizing transposase RayT